jgi:hypothetical protein
MSADSRNDEAGMRNGQRNRHLTRQGILNLLSAEEVASVTTAETAERLADGDVYVDLSRLEQGVRRARGDTTPISPVLPKKAVQEDTWKRILAHLAVLEGVARESKT